MTRFITARPLKKMWTGKKGRTRLQGRNILSKKPIHIHYMRKAILEAKKAAQRGEVPVGALLVKDAKIIAAAGNAIEEQKNALAHAELIVLNKANTILGRRLYGTTLYVTMEPCAMCAGAMVNSRIDHLVFGCFDDRGAAGSMMDVTDQSLNLHHMTKTGGILQEECRALLTEFFRERRRE